MPQNRRKKAQKIASVKKFGPSYVSPMRTGKKEKRYRTVTETQQFYQGWWLEILFVARVYWKKILNTFSCPRSGAYSCQ